ncbi:MAG: hypothetical protein PUF97_00660 [Bifidobacteriaceae bacterium]|nr:hypothetical protein [Bifidobacteriaceae bacterium]
MTAHNNTSDGNDSSDSIPPSSESHCSGHGDPDSTKPDAMQSDDEMWEQFVHDHEQDLSDLSNSHAARRFEREARRREKAAQKAQESQAMREFDDMAHEPTVRRGPRDFSTSILDDSPDDHFTPPNPSGNLSAYAKGYLALFIIGVVLLLLAVVVPGAAGACGFAGGMFVLLAIVALIFRPRD